MQYDVAIVGGGMVGTALACALGNTALRVVLLEANPPQTEWPAEGYDLRVSVSDGRDTRAAVVTVTVSAADTTPPSLTIDSPAPGSRVSGTVAIQVTASDDVAMDRVEVWSASGLLGADDSAPYQVDVATKRLGDGAHTLTVRAFDAAGNSGAATLDIVVKNRGRRGGAKKKSGHPGGKK